MRPKEYYRMAPRDYYAFAEGYSNKRKHDAELLRVSVWASLASWEGSLSFGDFCNRFFPLWFDEQPDMTPIEISEEEMQAIVNRHKMLHKNKTLNRSTVNGQPSTANNGS